MTPLLLAHPPVESTAIRADAHVHIVWIVDDPSYVQPELTVTSTSSVSLIITQERIEVKRKHVYPDYLNLARNIHGRVERQLRGKSKFDYVRKHCCQYDRMVNKRKTYIKSLKWK